MAETAITTRLRQVLVDFFEDRDGLHGHGCLLFVHGGNGVWVACSPDHEFELLNLAEHRVLPLASGQPLPDRVRGRAYVFDALEDGEEDELRRQAKLFAEAVGFSAVASDSSGEWLVSDTASPLLAQPVPNEALADPDSTAIREDKGLAYIGESWVHIERVDSDAEKRQGQAAPQRGRRRE